VRPKDVEFLLANATFLKKISHSSHQLRIDNVKGSFSGTTSFGISRGFEIVPAISKNSFQYMVSSLGTRT
jgi:hypothetical protein